MTTKLKKISAAFLCGKLFPLLLLIIMACTFAVQLPELGFYLDDWVSIAAYDQGGASGLISFGLNDSRPFTAWVMSKFFPVLGIGVLPWQLITLFWRFAAALTSFFLLRSIWPEQKAASGFISLFFGVFPYFRHQPICVAYFMISMQYFGILLSFLFTVKALQTENRAMKALLFFLSLLTSVFHLLCLEYYLSLEAARFIIVFIVLRKRDKLKFWETARKALFVYIPYILILVSLLAYRFVYIPSLSEDIRPLNLLTKYKGIKFIFHFIGLFLQYLVESFFGIWYRSINPSELDLTTRNTQLGLGLGLFAAVTVFLCLTFFRRDDSEDVKRSDYAEMLVLGAAAMLLGYLPGMVIDVSPASTSTYHDRFLIPSFWGISLFSFALLALTLKFKTLQNFLYSGMICIAVFFQIQNSFMYRYSWKYQQQFQWEMKWRVPDLEQNTAVISDGVIASFMGGWADSSMLIEMYGKQQGIYPTPYWYFSAGTSAYELSSLMTGNPIYIKSKMYEFQTDADNVLVLTKPEYGKCLWVLDEADEENPYLEEPIRPYLEYQNKSRIILDSDFEMPAEIFGSDYIHNWCYYFEKADLAFDQGRYEEVIRLYEEASSRKIKVGNATEMRPFIKSAAFSGNWDLALEWTEMAFRKNPEKTAAYFSNLWLIIDRDAPDTPGKAEAVETAADLFRDYLENTD